MEGAQRGSRMLQLRIGGLCWLGARRGPTASAIGGVVWTAGQLPYEEQVTRKVSKAPLRLRGGGEV